MNKSELVAAVADGADLSNAQATAALNAALDAITKAVADGDTVTVTGFGTFDRRHRAARTGRNPQTGEELQIAESYSPGFKASSTFKKAVAGS